MVLKLYNSTFIKHTRLNKSFSCKNLPLTCHKLLTAIVQTKKFQTFKLQYKHKKVLNFEYFKSNKKKTYFSVSDGNFGHLTAECILFS